MGEVLGTHGAKSRMDIFKSSGHEPTTKEKLLKLRLSQSLVGVAGLIIIKRLTN